jgi:hypothetical protein
VAGLPDAAAAPERGGRGPNSRVQLLVQRLEPVTHLLLGLAEDLPPDPLPVGPVAERDRSDEPVLRRRLQARGAPVVLFASSDRSCSSLLTALGTGDVCCSSVLTALMSVGGAVRQAPFKSTPERHYDAIHF